MPECRQRQCNFVCVVFMDIIVPYCNVQQKGSHLSMENSEISGVTSENKAKNSNEPSWKLFDWLFVKISILKLKRHSSCSLTSHLILKHVRFLLFFSFLYSQWHITLVFQQLHKIFWREILRLSSLLLILITSSAGYIVFLSSFNNNLLKHNF